MNSTFSTIDKLNSDSLRPTMWDTILDQNMITNYNQLLNQTDFFGGLETVDISSPISESSSASSTSSSPTSSSKQVSGRHKSLPDKVERRREQNRQSQRAYRDRKEKHQHELEAQISVWREKHEKLAKSYAAQTEHVSRLKAQVDNLNTQIISLQTGLPDLWGQTEQSQPDFDLVPFYDKRSGTWDRDISDQS